MNVLHKGSGTACLMPVETSLLSRRQIFLEGEITTQSAAELTRQILYLNQEDRDRPITLLINSEGGEVKAGLLLYDVIRSSPAPVRLVCLEKAYSMAALLLSSGKHGRYILPHASTMLHEPLLGNRIEGSSSSLKAISDALLETKKSINRILSANTGKTMEEIDQATGYDHFLSAEESVAFGLCDGVIEFGQLLDD